MRTAPVPGTGAVIRPYEAADRAAVYDVCVRTADAGGDARGRWSTDDLMPDLFAGPYVDLQPELAFVLARLLRTEWLPRMTAKYPEPDDQRTPERRMVGLLYRPERML